MSVLHKADLNTSIANRTSFSFCYCRLVNPYIQSGHIFSRCDIIYSEILLKLQSCVNTDCLLHFIWYLNLALPSHQPLFVHCWTSSIPNGKYISLNIDRIPSLIYRRYLENNAKLVSKKFRISSSNTTRMDLDTNH